MDDQVSEIFQQLNQICDQYKREIPGRRRAWPKSIKDRIFALQRAGVNAHQIAKQVPVPYMTIVSWNTSEKRRGSFLPVRVVRSHKPTTVTVVGRGRPRKTNLPVVAVPTVTVVTPSGIRVEGLGADVVMAWLKGGQL